MKEKTFKKALEQIRLLKLDTSKKHEKRTIRYKNPLNTFANIMETAHKHCMNLYDVAQENDNVILSALWPFIEEMEQARREAEQTAYEAFENRIMGEYRLIKYMKEDPGNGHILEEVLEAYPRIIKKLETAIDAAKHLQDLGHGMKQVKIGEGETFLLFFKRKYIRKGRKYVVGTDEHNRMVALHYAYIFNFDKYNKGFKWEPGAAYHIKHDGMKKGKNFRGSYHTFTIEKINENG